MPRVRSARPGEAESLAGVLARAFGEDPLVGYLFPEPARRHERLCRFFEMQLRHNYFVRGEVLTDEDRHACALWLPPVPRQARLGDVLAQGVLPFVLGTRVGAARRVASILALHHPTTPHWYLGPIGTDPPYQCRGLGTALIAHVLARCDADSLPAYLESSNQTNLSLYTRLGFRLSEELHLAPDGPRLWLMWRPPAPGRRDTGAPLSAPGAAGPPAADRS
jgi:ribosomal protein S18 acetylase RimI-like enzyme